MNINAGDYSKRILTEKVQKYIAELGIDVYDYSMLFKENKIILLIPDAKWTSNNKETLETAEKLMNSL